MKITFILCSLILLTSCTKELPITGEVPVTNSCLKEALSLIDGWNNDYQGTRIELHAEYIKFAKNDYGVSPVKGYIRLRTGNLVGEKPDVYLNTLAGLCQYSEQTIIDRDYLGYRVLNEVIMRNLETGTKELYIQSLNNKIKVSKRRGN